MRTKARHYYPPIKKCRGSTLSQVRPNKLFPQKNARPEVAQKERKKAPKKYFLAHIQTLVKCFDLVSLPACPGEAIRWATYVSF
jgi:hypothetical protein